MFASLELVCLLFFSFKPVYSQEFRVDISEFDQVQIFGGKYLQLAITSTLKIHTFFVLAKFLVVDIVLGKAPSFFVGNKLFLELRMEIPIIKKKQVGK